MAPLAKLSRFLQAQRQSKQGYGSHVHSRKQKMLLPRKSQVLTSRKILRLLLIQTDHMAPSFGPSSNLRLEWHTCACQRSSMSGARTIRWRLNELRYVSNSPTIIFNVHNLIGSTYSCMGHEHPQVSGSDIGTAEGGPWARVRERTRLGLIGNTYWNFAAQTSLPSICCLIACYQYGDPSNPQFQGCKVSSLSPSRC